MDVASNGMIIMAALGNAKRAQANQLNIAKMIVDDEEHLQHLRASLKSETAVRDDAIRIARDAGAGVREISRQTGMSASRICEITKSLMGPGGIEMEAWYVIKNAVADSTMPSHEQEILINAMVTALRGYNPATGQPVPDRG